jgi:3-oxoacyl-[acyl-carrier protein] reductase
MVPETGSVDESLKDPGAFARRLDVEFPLGRMGTPEEVADVIAFVCSSRASLINGASIAIDGGESRSF